MVELIRGHWTILFVLYWGDRGAPCSPAGRQLPNDFGQIFEEQGAVLGLVALRIMRPDAQHADVILTWADRYQRRRPLGCGSAKHSLHLLRAQHAGEAATLADQFAGHQHFLGFVGRPIQPDQGAHLRLESLGDLIAPDPGEIGAVFASEEGEDGIAGGVEQPIVFSADIGQLGQLLPRGDVALPQHTDLPLDQRDRTFPPVWQVENRQQAGSILQEIGMLSEEGLYVFGVQCVGHVFRSGSVVVFVTWLRPWWERFRRAGQAPRAHWQRYCGALPEYQYRKEMVPSNTEAVGPPSHTGASAPSQLTESLPPGSFTATVASSKPRLIPWTTAAQAPDPQASVSPTPRS